MPHLLPCDRPWHSIAGGMLCGSPKLRAPTIIYLYRRHFPLAQLITSSITLLEESHMGWLHPWPSRSFVRKLNTSTLSRTWVEVRSEQNRTQNLFLFACPAHLFHIAAHLAPVVLQDFCSCIFSAHSILEDLCQCDLDILDINMILCETYIYRKWL